MTLHITSLPNVIYRLAAGADAVPILTTRKFRFFPILCSLIISPCEITTFTWSVWGVLCSSSVREFILFVKFYSSFYIFVTFWKAFSFVSFFVKDLYFKQCAIHKFFYFNDRPRFHILCLWYLSKGAFTTKNFYCMHSNRS